MSRSRLNAETATKERYERALRKFIASRELQAFPAIVVEAYLSDGIESLVQCHGIGGLRPNTVLIGWPKTIAKAEAFGATLRLVTRLRRSLVSARLLLDLEETGGDQVCEETEAALKQIWEAPEGTIDVWWRGKKMAR